MGGALGFFAAGPAGAAVLSVAGAVVSKVFTNLGEEVSDRLLEFLTTSCFIVHTSASGDLFNFGMLTRRVGLPEDFSTK